MYGAFNQAKRRCRRFRLTAPVVVAAGLLLSSAAVAQVYPVNGVFSAIDTNFPDRNGACLALKAFGMEAVSKRAVPKLLIFTNDKRYYVKGDAHSEQRLKSIKKTDFGFRITELAGDGRRLLGLGRKTSYILKIVDSRTIEIWDGATVAHYAKCESWSPSS